MLLLYRGLKNECVKFFSFNHMGIIIIMVRNLPPWYIFFFKGVIAFVYGYIIMGKFS